MRRTLPALILLLLVAPARAQESAELDLSTLLGRLEKRYRVEIVHRAPTFPVETAHGFVRGAAASEAELEAYAPVLLREFSRYPQPLVRRSALKRIVLCRELAFGDQARMAIPEFGSATMYYDVRAVRSGERYAVQVLHHEYFHFLDWKDDGLVYEDAGWTALNAPEFRYGEGGARAQSDPTMSLLTDRYPGFLTKYGTTGVEEDKAELFAHLLMDPEVVEQRAAQDQLLAHKVERMKSLLKSFCKQVDARFWEQHAKQKAEEREAAARAAAEAGAAERGGAEGKRGIAR